MSKEKRMSIFLALILGSFLLLYKYFLNVQKKSLLKNFNEKEAVLIKINAGKGVHSTTYGVFEYSLNNKKIRFDDSNDYRMLKVGDTVLIKYSLEDPTVAEVVDKYYMNKYKKELRK